MYKTKESLAKMSGLFTCFNRCTACKKITLNEHLGSGKITIE